MEFIVIIAIACIVGIVANSKFKTNRGEAFVQELSKEQRVAIFSIAVFNGIYKHANANPPHLNHKAIAFEMACYRLAHVNFWFRKQGNEQVFSRCYPHVLRAFGQFCEWLSQGADGGAISLERVRYYRKRMEKSEFVECLQQDLPNIALATSSRGIPEVGNMDLVLPQDALELFFLSQVFVEWEKETLELSIKSLEALCQELK
ncbi:MAG: hypothetical protein NTZ46_08490 [Verrucomicrobia bacterium]|nr:hypothetical protein [Verrucomicrobiota bacterium]